MRCRSSCAVIVLAAANWSAAVGAESFTLEQAIAAMEDGNESLEAARSEVRAVGGDAVAARLWDNPGLEVDYIRDKIGDAGTFPEYDVSISQLFDVTGARAARYRSADFEFRATQADYQATLASMRLGVEAAFIDLAEAFEQLDVMSETRDQVARITRIVRDRVENGAAARYDAGRASLSLADVTADVRQAQADLAAARGAFEAAVGARADRLGGRPAYNMMREAVLGDLPGLVTQAMKTRPDVVAARDRALSARETVKATSRGRFPGVVVSAGANDGPAPNETALTAGVSLTIPILDRGQGTVPAATARATSAEWALRALETKVGQVVGAAYRQMEQQQQAQRDYADSGVVENQEVLAQAEAAYTEGKSNILDLLDAFLSYREAKLRLLDLAQAARQSEVALKRAVYAPGDGTPD